MLQAPMLDSLSFDFLPFDQNGLAAPEVDVGGREVAQALVVTAVIVVLDEGLDLSFEGDSTTRNFGIKFCDRPDSS